MMVNSPRYQVRDEGKVIRDKYEADERFERIIAELAIELDPELAAIDQLLDDDGLFQLIRADLVKRNPQSEKMGSPATPVEVSLRMLAAKRLYGWSYRQTETYVADSLVLRLFCRVYLEAVPDYSTLNKIAQVIGQETLQQFNERVIELALAHKATRGRKLRTDGTVVESEIAYPSDSKLLADGVRVLSRTLKRAQGLLSPKLSQGGELFRDRTRSARNQARQIGQRARQRSQAAKEKMSQAYRRLIQISRQMISQSTTVLAQLQQQRTTQTQTIIEILTTFIPRVEQALDQTIRRVQNGEKVPATEKILSLFEAHTDLIRRGKPGKETEFGHKVWFDEVDGGLVTRWLRLKGNPPDESQWQPAIDHHQRLFGRPPDQASADRGVYSPDNESYATAQAVKRVILPQPGRKDEARAKHEAQPWFKRGRKFHAGVEGRISVLKRRYQLDRCRDHGLDNFDKWVGWGVIANNLTAISRKMAH